MPGQRILTATTQYKLERDTSGKLATQAAVDDIARSAKAAVRMQGDQSLDGCQSKWFSGSALQYGVTMNPLCMSPKHARYARVLPQTSLHRIWNALLFKIVEPICRRHRTPSRSTSPSRVRASPNSGAGVRRNSPAFMRQSNSHLAH